MKLKDESIVALLSFGVFLILIFMASMFSGKVQAFITVIAALAMIFVNDLGRADKEK